ncbi:amino acid ABC transporter ATP-binding protein [Lentilactobacillus raoultii]|uniref:Amino acid ABC transporter ATP-binding protein n=1 Tax=Lentilactobacillus raoultii TaxID=1987503 RepID=A0ABW3PLN3_9LACO|nr:amino acid ABC transporter ATP-binding protein [Lentilactobacillus raoultii]
MIKLKNLTKRYNNQTVFKDLNLRIDTGQVVGVIGPSGAGKSTLLRCINLLEKPDSGSISIDDQVVTAPHFSTKESIELRQKSSMVFQQFNLFRQKTILSNVTEGLMTVKKLKRPQAVKIAKNVINRVQLTDQINKYPSQLSGGQKQRVGIARALAMDTDVLLMDEPTSALDTELVGDVLDTIKKVIEQNEQQTIIIISHELQFIKDVASRVLFFDQGKILEDGTPEQIFDSPQNPRTQQFLTRYRQQGI